MMENAVTYEQLLTLKWKYGKFSYPFKPGYNNLGGDTNYFGTDPKSKVIVSVNAAYCGTTHVCIKEDGGSRTVFHGQVRSLDELKLILALIQ